MEPFTDNYNSTWVQEGELMQSKGRTIWLQRAEQPDGKAESIECVWAGPLTHVTLLSLLLLFSLFTLGHYRLNHFSNANYSDCTLQTNSKPQLDSENYLSLCFDWKTTIQTWYLYKDASPQDRTTGSLSSMKRVYTYLYLGPCHTTKCDTGFLWWQSILRTWNCLYRSN